MHRFDYNSQNTARTFWRTEKKQTIKGKRYLLENVIPELTKLGCIVDDLKTFDDVDDKSKYRETKHNKIFLYDRKGSISVILYSSTYIMSYTFIEIDKYEDGDGKSFYMNTSSKLSDRKSKYLMYMISSSVEYSDDKYHDGMVDGMINSIDHLIENQENGYVNESIWNNYSVKREDFVNLTCSYDECCDSFIKNGYFESMNDISVLCNYFGGEVIEGHEWRYNNSILFTEDPEKEILLSEKDFTIIEDPDKYKPMEVNIEHLIKLKNEGHTEVCGNCGADETSKMLSRCRCGSSNFIKIV